MTAAEQREPITTQAAWIDMPGHEARNLARYERRESLQSAQRPPKPWLVVGPHGCGNGKQRELPWVTFRRLAP